MSDVLLRYRGREIREADVVFLRELIAQNPTFSRYVLSVKACEVWNWVQPNGQLRHQVCRSLMLALHRAGLIQLPAPRRTLVNNALQHRRVAGSPRQRLILDGLEPCEGKLSCTVLRGA